MRTRRSVPMWGGRWGGRPRPRRTPWSGSDLTLVRTSHNPPDDVAHAPVSRLFSTLRRAVTQRSESERRQEWRRGTQSACATSSPKKSGEICGLDTEAGVGVGRGRGRPPHIRKNGDTIACPRPENRAPSTRVGDGQAMVSRFFVHAPCRTDRRPRQRQEFRRPGAGRSGFALGCLLIQADELGHQVQEPGGEAYDDIVREFGRENPQPRRPHRPASPGGRRSSAIRSVLRSSMPWSIRWYVTGGANSRRIRPRPSPWHRRN